MAIYEFIAIVVSGIGLALVSGRGMGQAFVASTLASVTAIVWNYVFNTGFEFWESRQSVKGRSIRRRIAHAIGFEGGLLVFLVPLFSWQLQVTLWQAFVMNFGLLIFFLIYTFVFTWCFDRIFGLPASAGSAG